MIILSRVAMEHFPERARSPVGMQTIRSVLTVWEPAIRCFEGRISWYVQIVA